MMNERTAPRVTVVMTLFNKAPFVAEAVQSVLAGSFADLELLVVNDASTDDGPARVNAIRDPRVRTITLATNLGRGAAAKRGFSEAKGEYIAVLDADDRMDHDRLKRQVEYLDAHMAVGVCGSAAHVTGKRPHTAQWPLTDRECRARILFDDPVLYGSAMFRRAVLVAHGVLPDAEWRTPGMDYLFQVALSPYTQFANLPEPLTTYRIHPGNMRHGRDPIADKVLIQTRVFELLGIPATTEEVRIHLLLHKLFLLPPTAQDIRALKAWTDKLLQMNRERGLFPAQEFEHELRARCEVLFHTLTERSVKNGLSYLRVTRSASPAQWGFWLKAAVRRVIGTRP